MLGRERTSYFLNHIVREVKVDVNGSLDGLCEVEGSIRMAREGIKSQVHDTLTHFGEMALD
jgi:hypothetical protein